MINSFEEAIAFYQMAKWHKDDLPDGQWTELKELMDDLKIEYGAWGTWNAAVRSSFIDEVKENYVRWL